MKAEQLKIMKEKAENSRGRVKDELTQAYKSYADYAFTDKQTHHSRCKNAEDQLHTVNKEKLLQRWTFDRSIQKYISEMVYQTMHCYNKKS